MTGKNLNITAARKKLNKLKSNNLLIWWLKVGLSIVLAGLTFAYLVDWFVMPSIVSHGEEFKMPDVRNLTYEDAGKLLAENGFKLAKASEKVDYKIPSGQIIEQNPKAGSVCKKGRRVYVLISSGSLPAIVPNLLGLSPQDAIYQIQKAKLNLDTVLYDFSSEYPEGVVMGQELTVNDTVQMGKKMFIVVSSGNHPNEFIVPDLVGKDLNQAISIVKKSGLKVAQIIKISDDDLLPNTVIRQEPLKDEIVIKDSEVTIYVSTP